MRKAGVDLTERQRVVEWRAVDTEKRKAEVPVMAYIRDRFAEQRAAVLDAIHAQKADLRVEQVFDIEPWLRELGDALPDVLIDVLREGFETGALRIDHDGTFDASSPSVRRTLRSVVEQTKAIDRTTAETLREVILEGQEDGRTIDEIAADVDEAFDQASRVRARMIAQTTTTASFEAGQQDAFDDAGITHKQWLSQRDGRVRDTHWSADGQTVAMPDRFEVGGASLRFPADPDGPANETINCRCTTLPRMNE